MIGCCKITGNREELFQDFISMKFSTIIKRNGFEFIFMTTNGFTASPVHFFNGSGPNLFNDDKSGFAFNQSDNTVMTVFADYFVAFPMADIDTVVNFNWTVLDHAFSG